MTITGMTGDEAVAHAAKQSKVDIVAAYPITPQTELLEYLSRKMPELGRAFVQAESEIGAINMVYGAASGGAGPGFRAAPRRGSAAYGRAGLRRGSNRRSRRAAL